MKRNAIDAIDLAIAKTEELIKQDNDPLLPSLRDVLQGYKAIVTDHWPLTLNEKENIDIGRVAVRELYDTYPEYVKTLSHLGARLREEMAP